MSPCGSCKKKLGITCCELPVGETPTFGLTTNEVRRILEHTRKSFKDVFTIEKLTKEEVAAFVSKSSVFGKIFHAGWRIRLQVEPQKDGKTSACVFLKKGVGCSLPSEVRPHACRLYPFWFDDSVTKGYSLYNTLFSGACYAKMVMKSDAHLLELFGANEEELLKVVETLVADAKAHVEELNGQSKKEKADR